MTDSTTSLRRIYAEVCQGYSTREYAGSTVYVRHFNVFDYTEIDQLRDEAFDFAVSRGLHTEATKLKWLEEKGLWTKKDDLELKQYESYVQTLHKSRSKLPLKAQIVQADKQIAEGEAKLGGMVNKRANLLGKTAEHVADQKIQYEYMRLGFFKDPLLKERLLTTDDINSMDDQQAEDLLHAYVNVINQFGAETLRKIAVSPFFTNYFYLVGERLETFFGKPIVGLTLYQTNLLSYGNYFKSLMTQTEVPKEMMGDPNKIEEYIMRSRNMKTMASKMDQNADRVAIIGATGEDFKAMGVEDGSAIVQKDFDRGVKNGIEAAKTRTVTFNEPRR